MNHKVMQQVKRITLMLAVMLIAFPALALNLQEAKQQGLVGEMPNGYIGAVVNNPNTQALVKHINNMRKQSYIKMARKHGLSLNEITSLAGARFARKLLRGIILKVSKGSG